jgi:oxalate decarboxylase/phosphoglucose isomerase-like protein (cupin superfamily)
MFSKTILFATILPSLISAADPQSRTVKPEVNAALKTAATNFDRNAILSQTSAWYYDFDSHQNFDAEQGAVINADAASFPALTGMGISIALLKLAPCGMLPPHYHPRAHNLVTAVSGNTTSWMIGENGVKTHMVDLIPFRVTIFPQGSLHVMQNNGISLFILSFILDIPVPTW